MNNRIAQIRTSMKLSQEEFGNRIGLKRSAVSLFESGRNAISEQTIRLILSEFPVNEAWLREGTGEMLENDAEARKQRLMEKYNKEGDPFKDWLLDCVIELPDEQWALLKAKIQEGAEACRKEDEARAAAIAAEAEAYKKELEAEQKGATSSASEKRETA
jgi:transcriptional regulator with XRE-family HTH domain